jgi:hypothetical protein
MKKQNKKLTLSRETLLSLNGVTGGYTSIPCLQHTQLCNTNTSNPSTPFSCASCLIQTCGCDTGPNDCGTTGTC